LTGSDTGTAIGTINYTFYCDRGDSGTNITPGYIAKFDGVSDNPKTITCSYPNPGAYTPKVIVERGTGAAEARQKVTATSSQNAPTIAAVQPSSFSASANQQLITIIGIGFQAELTVSLISPNGSTQTVSGTQLQNFSSSTFQISVVLNTIGTWTITVTNPDRQSSGAAFLNVTSSGTVTVSPQTWSPVFTVGDPFATLGFQITNTVGGPLTGTISASANGSWLTVDGLTSEQWVIPGGAINNTGISVTANSAGLSAGTYTGSLVVNAPNASNPTVTVPVSMAIYDKLQITTLAFPDAVSGQPYNFPLQGSGGTATGYSWILQQGTNGTLPNGLSLNPQTGVISGTPTGISGSTTLMVRIVLNDSLGHSASKLFPIVWRQGIVIDAYAPAGRQVTVGTT
jgi:hypothetical protein